jgi:hypothetical protein
VWHLTLTIVLDPSTLVDRLESNQIQIQNLTLNKAEPGESEAATHVRRPFRQALRGHAVDPCSTFLGSLLSDVVPQLSDPFYGRFQFSRACVSQLLAPSRS